MSTFLIHPDSSDAKVAIGAVKNHATKYSYRNYIKVYGKTSGKVSGLSHIDMITDASKADENGYLSPADWLEIYHQPATNRFKSEVQKQ